MRNLLRALLILTLLLALVPPALADGAASLPQVLKVEAGFEGRAKSGKWVPVTLTLKNDGAEFEGLIRFETRTQFGPAQQTAVYRTPVVLPAGATKRYTVIVPTEMAGIPQINLLAKDGSEALSVSPAVETGWDVNLGVLGVEPAELKSLGAMQLGQRKVHLIRLDPAAMPADALILENLDAVLLDRFAYAELPAPQRQALEAWVEHGGTLILAGGPEAARLEGLTDWAHFKVSGIETISLDGVGQAPLANLELGSGWRMTRQAGAGIPLVAKLRKGMGTIHLLAFDPGLEPFASWKGLPGLVQSLLPADPMAGMGPGMNPVGMKAQYVLMDSLRNFPVKEIPATKGLIYLLAAYAVLIGPVHFLLLKGFRRTGWALLSLPLLAGLGAGGAWAYTRTAMASDMLVNTIGVIEGQPEGSSLKVSALVGFHLPPGSSHSTTMGSALLSSIAVPPMPGPNGNMEPEQPPTTVEEGRTAILERSESWMMRAVSAESFVPVAGTVKGRLTVGDFRATGQLTSALPFGLKDALVVSGMTFAKLGNIEPGQTVDVSMVLPAFTQEFGGGNPLGEAIGRAFQFNGWGPNGPTPEEMEMMRRQQTGWAATSSIRWAQATDRPPLILMGWTDAVPLPLAIDGRETTMSGTALYVQPLPYGFSDGEVTVPSSFLGARLVEWNGDQGFPGQLMPGWSLPQGGSVTVDFDLPEGLLGRVGELVINTPALGRGPSGKYPLRFEFFRWSDESWHDPGLTAETANPMQADGFISAGGTVRVRIIQTIDERMPLGTPGLTLRGKGAQ